MNRNTKELETQTKVNKNWSHQKYNQYHQSEGRIGESRIQYHSHGKLGRFCSTTLTLLLVRQT